jgi:hypothetical protein
LAVIQRLRYLGSIAILVQSGMQEGVALTQSAPRDEHTSYQDLVLAP